MAWSIFLSALGLVFVFEGILPFLSPNTWRRMVQQMIAQPDRALRIMGLISMLVGLTLVSIAHEIF